MKNIFLIPTDKPSRLYYTISKNGYRLNLSEIPRHKSSEVRPQNIYITSSEKIKIYDWYLDDTNFVRQAITECESYWTHRKKYKKIILTTDPTLIADGVQSIDDDVLECTNDVTGYQLYHHLIQKYCSGKQKKTNESKK